MNFFSDDLIQLYYWVSAYIIFVSQLINVPSYPFRYYQDCKPQVWSIQYLRVAFKETIYLAFLTRIPIILKLIFFIFFVEIVPVLLLQFQILN